MSAQLNPWKRIFPDHRIKAQGVGEGEWDGDEGGWLKEWADLRERGDPSLTLLLQKVRRTIPEASGQGKGAGIGLTLVKISIREA